MLLQTNLNYIKYAYIFKLDSIDKDLKMVLTEKPLNKIQYFQKRKEIQEFAFKFLEISKELAGQLDKKTFIYSNFFLTKS
jgi:hypothetical protein